MDRFDVTIGGAAVQVRVGTLSIQETINGRNTLNADVLSVSTPAVRPAVGEALLADDDDVPERVFGGNLKAVTEQAIDEQLVNAFLTRISVVDFNAIADRRTVIDGAFPAGFTLKQAATSLLGYLSPYGVTLDPAQVDGPVLPLMGYAVKRVSEWFNELSIVTGYIWEIDYDKVLRFIEPGSVSAPFGIADDDGHTVGDIQIEPSDVAYANRVILLAGTGQKDVTVALTFDGVEDTFVLPYTLVTDRGYVTANGVDETLGAGATWEFDPLTNSLTRMTGAPAAGSGSFNYTAQFPYRAQADDLVEQAGPRGIVDTVVTRADLFEADFADALAEGYLVRFVEEPRTIRYATFTPGLHAGMTQPISSSKRNVTIVAALITEVRARDLNGEQMRYDVTAVEGSVYPGSWRDLYKKWSSGATGSAAGVTGSVVVASGGSSASAFPLGGSRSASIAVGVTSAPVLDWQPLVAPRTESVRIRVTTRARTAGVNVTPQLYRYDSGSMTWVLHVSGSANSGTAEVEQEFLASLTAGQVYRLQFVTDTAGASAYCIGQSRSV